MRISTPEELEQLVFEIARERFGFASFRRRELVKLTEDRLRSQGLWTSESEPASGLVPLNPNGLTAIDEAISRLGEARRLVKLGYDLWAVAATSLSLRRADSMSLGSGMTRADILRAERLERLRSASGSVTATPLLDDAFARETLYEERA